VGQLQALTDLDAAYQLCRRINARHGRTYFLATRLLPADRRPAIHALYGFARVADEIVDAPGVPPADRITALDSLAEDLRLVVGTSRDRSDLSRALPATSRFLVAVGDTVGRYGIRVELFTEFLESMRMDLTVTDYATFADLERYMYGSAGAIGLQLLPVLGTVGPQEEAAPAAAALGEAFQLTNFLRDVGEDLDRGRLYLPSDELAAFGVDRARLEWAHRTGTTDPPVRAALAHLVAYTRAVYRRAEPGISLLRPESRPCVRTAATLYRGILDEIEAAGYAILHRRVTVPPRRRLAVAATGLLRRVALTAMPGVTEQTRRFKN
jgi:phytoene synthase